MHTRDVVILRMLDVYMRWAETVPEILGIVTDPNENERETLVDRS